MIEVLDIYKKQSNENQKMRDSTTAPARNSEDVPVTVEDVAYADARNSQLLQTGTQVQHLTTSQISVDSSVRDSTANDLVRDSIKPLA